MGYEWAVWRHGKLSTLEELLGVESANNLAPRYSDTYKIESIKELVDINKHDQIVAHCRIWDETHICILTPNESSQTPD